MNETVAGVRAAAIKLIAHVDRSHQYERDGCDTTPGVDCTPWCGACKALADVPAELLTEARTPFTHLMIPNAHPPNGLRGTAAFACDRDGSRGVHVPMSQRTSNPTKVTCPGCKAVTAAIARVAAYWVANKFRPDLAAASASADEMYVKDPGRFAVILDLIDQVEASSGAQDGSLR